MDCFVALGDGGHIVLGRRIAWPEFSDPGDSGGRSLWIASRCLGSVLHSGLASSCPCSWVLVGYDLGICDWRISDSAFWCGVIFELSNAIDSIWVRRIGRACYFRYCLRDDSGLRSLFGWFATAFGHRDRFSLLLGADCGGR